MFGDTVVDHAKDRGLPVVLMTNWELVHVAQGHPMIVRTESGDEVCVRLPTVDELIAAAEAAGDRLEAQGCARGPGMPRHMAVQLSTPLPEPGRTS